MPFKHEVHKSETIREQSDWYSLTVGNYEVLLVRDDQCSRLSICPSGADWGFSRLGIVQCHPKDVSDLEQFAEVAESLLKTIAAELRAAGVTDLRSRSDKMIDEMKEERERMIRDFRAQASEKRATESS